MLESWKMLSCNFWYGSNKVYNSIHIWLFSLNRRMLKCNMWLTGWQQASEQQLPHLFCGVSHDQPWQSTMHEWLSSILKQIWCNRLDNELLCRIVLVSYAITIMKVSLETVQMVSMMSQWLTPHIIIDITIAPLFTFWNLLKAIGLPWQDFD